MNVKTKVRCMMLVGSLATAVLLSCAGKVRYPDYYTLAIAPSVQPPSDTLPASETIAVRRFETPGYLRQGRIVYRETPERLGFYEYHRWAADPAIPVTTAIIESLRSTGRFTSVGPYDGQGHAEYLLNGRLDKLEEVDYKNSLTVEVKLSATLLNARTGATMWAGSVTRSSDVPTRDMNSVVSAMSEATQDAIEHLVANMQEKLSHIAAVPGNALNATASSQ
jgi:ABC-type uncharacterized transport system auxiliary subunit